MKYLLLFLIFIVSCKHQTKEHAISARTFASTEDRNVKDSIIITIINLKGDTIRNGNIVFVRPEEEFQLEFALKENYRTFALNNKDFIKLDKKIFNSIYI